MNNITNIKKVLIGCEESQRVCIEFRKLGFKAYSNDVIDCSGGHHEWHLKMDVFYALEYCEWDLIIMHPPCTYLAVSGNRWYGEGTKGFEKRLNAVEWTQKLWDKATSICNYVVMENPVGVLNKYGNFPKPKYIHPWQYGHGETKKTGLWLNNLPELKPTNIVEGREQRIWKLPPSNDRRELRSKTYSGIAKAMSEQWGKFLLENNGMKI